MKNKLIPLLLFIAYLTPLSMADVKLPHIFDDHMVLQRDCPIPVWGRASAREEITIRLGPHEVATTADAKGAWSVELPSLEAGGPHSMTVHAKNTIRLSDVLVGEVWICAGQCNMEMPLAGVDGAEAEIAAAACPGLRLCHIPNEPFGQPIVDVNTSWFCCTPATAQQFSGAAYFFGRKLNEELNVPIGIIQATRRHSKIDAWIPKEGFLSVPRLAHVNDEVLKKTEQYENSLTPRLDAFEAWISKAREALKTGASVPAMPEVPAHPLRCRTKPTGLFNGMIHPLIPFGIRGVTWYQGEQDIWDAWTYDLKMEALIRGWRSLWKRGDFPFYFVQLTPYGYGRSRPTEDAESGNDPCQLPRMWDSQMRATRLPQTGLAPTTDIGDPYQIRPTNKKEVGRRLALLALHGCYGRDGLTCSGPIFKKATREGSHVRIHFDNPGEGLKTSDGLPPTWFEVAGEDKKFFPAQAEIDNDSVLIWNENVTDARLVRFNWHQEAQSNLINVEGLPAYPFRIHIDMH